jgi:metal-responsive CopG/Arc/MetJ family transcriptional regulator
MDMTRLRRPISVTLDPELLAELDAWLEAQPYKPNRAQFIETAIRQELDRAKGKGRK